MKELLIPRPVTGRLGLHDWATHIPVLVTVLDRLQPVTILEMGAGDWSTIVFHNYVTAVPGRHLLSLENDKTWLDGLQWQACAQHELRYVKDWDPQNYDGHYDLIFIDQAPEHDRQAALGWAASHCRVAVLHDDNYPERYGRYYELYDSRVGYNVYRFCTGVYGKGVDVTQWWPSSRGCVL